MSEEMIASLLKGIADKQNDHAIEFAKVATTVNDMNKRLFGNGQPGALHYLNQKIEASEAIIAANATTSDKEISRIDKKIVWFAGIALGGGTILFYVVRAILNKMGMNI